MNDVVSISPPREWAGAILIMILMLVECLSVTFAVAHKVNIDFYLIKLNYMSRFPILKNN